MQKHFTLNKLIYSSFFAHLLFPVMYWVALACLYCFTAEPFFMSSVIAMVSNTDLGCAIGRISPLSCVAALVSSTVESPFFTFPPLRGNTTKRALYDLRRSTFAWRPWTDLFFLRWSTAIPIDKACFALIPASFSSWRVNPRPYLILVLYLWVGHLTAGRRRPATGLGATLSAFALRASLRFSLRPGWSRNTLTRNCQCFLKWPLGNTLLCFTIFPV